jgi:hypothetical protein
MATFETLLLRVLVNPVEDCRLCCLEYFLRNLSVLGVLAPFVFGKHRVNARFCVKIVVSFPCCKTFHVHLCNRSLLHLLSKGASDRCNEVHITIVHFSALNLLQDALLSSDRTGCSIHLFLLTTLS